jgi:phosphoribosylamine-glycine ligase
MTERALGMTEKKQDGGAIRLNPAGSNIACIVTARGADLNDAVSRVVRTLKKISIEGKQYRDDIGAGVLEKHRRLKEWGFIDG